MREDYPNYLEKRFLAAEALARRESLTLANLTAWCERGDLQARQINDQWFINLNDWEANGSRLISRRVLNPIRVVHSPILLVAVLVFFVVIIAWTPLQDRFRAGSALLTATVGATSHVIVQNSAQARMASVYDGLWIKLERFWFGIDRLTRTIADNLVYFWRQAALAWHKFIGPETSTPPLVPEAATLDTLKAEIKAELLRELGRNEEKNSSVSPSNAPGLVVLPASGDPAYDEALKLELKNTFSDRVEVQFDPSGRAGIITPIFRTGRGDNYLFILTPLNRRP